MCIRDRFNISNKLNLDLTILFQNCLFQNNTSDEGGGIHIFETENSTDFTIPNNGNLVVEMCTFMNNTALSGGGGAINIEQSNHWTFRDNTFCDNSCDGSNDGGAIRFFDSKKIEILDSEFYGNNTLDDGGAIYILLGEAFINNCDFVSNYTDSNASSSYLGGAIFGSTSTGIDIENSNFYFNSSASGGAVYINSTFNNTGDPNDIINCTFVSNHALEDSGFNSSGGGAVKGSNTVFNIVNSYFVDNIVEPLAFGGAINNHSSDISLTNNLFYNNLKGGNSSILGSDIIAINTGSFYTPLQDNKMQLSGSGGYLLQDGTPNPSSYVFTNDSFSNTDDGSLPPAPSIVCSTGIVPPGLLAGCDNELCGNGIDDNGDGRVDEAYPGGVQDNLQLWLNGDIGTNTVVEAADVTSWQDQSSNNYSANADVNSNRNPLYAENAINYHPGVHFAGDYLDDFSDGLHLGSDYIYPEGGGFNIFAVVLPVSGAGSGQNDAVVDFGGTFLDGYGLTWFSDATRSKTPNGAGGALGFHGHFTGDLVSLIEMDVDFQSTKSTFLNGSQIDVENIPSLSQILPSDISSSDHYGTSANGDHLGGPFSIGRVSASQFVNQGRVFGGIISEVLVYNDSLSASDTEKINSYLAIKYGITLSHNYVNSSGTILKDITDGYANDIAGIGVDSCGGLDQRQSMSVNESAIVSIANGSFASSNSTNGTSFDMDNTSLIWGHNGAPENSVWDGTNYDIPGGDFLGIDRVWKADLDLNIGSTLLNINVDNPLFDLPALPPYPSSNELYYLFADDDGDFTNGGTVALPMVPGSGSSHEVVFNTNNSSFFFSFGVRVPEICGNGIDDDGDGLVDCADCDSCGNSPLCPDKDNDGISNSCDKDDDNDGILDTDEGVLCESFDLSALDGSTDALTDFNAAALDIAGSTIQINTPLVFNGTATMHGNLINDNHETGSIGVNFGVDNGGTSADNLEMSYVFSEPICEFNGRLLDVDQENVVEVYSYFDGVENTYTISNQGPCINFDGSNTFSSSCNVNASVANGNVDDHAFNLNFDDCIDSIFFRFYSMGTFNSGTFTFVISPNPSCIYLDTDADGTPDYLDLDSDEDGCPDALEGVSAFNPSQIANDTLIGGIDIDGIPLLASPGGQAVGSSRDSTTLANECLVEICGNGLDDDGNGLIDCADEECCCAQAPTLSKF